MRDSPLSSRTKKGTVPCCRAVPPVALLLLLPSAAAIAREPADAGAERRKEIAAVLDERVAHYRERRFAEALERFEAAHRLSSDPMITFNIATALEALGRHAPAAAAYDRFLTATVSIARTDEGRIRAARGALARPK